MLRVADGYVCAGGYPALVDSGSFDIVDNDEVVVVSDVGSFSCVDVWFHVPDDWTDQVTVRIYGRIGGARVLLHSSLMGSSPITSEGGFSSGIAGSLRGRPMRGVEVTCQGVHTPFTGGRVMLHAWHDQSSLAGSNVEDAPSVHARLVAKDSVSGEPREVTATSSGSLRSRGATS